MVFGFSARRTLGFLTLLTAFCFAPAWGQCDESQLANYTGDNQFTCVCFVPGEEAGSVFNLPAGDFPIEILRVGIVWGSLSGGQPDSLEQSIHIYGAGLPDPGAPLFSLDAPVLTDGAINEFNLEPLPGKIIINSGPFTVTLEFANSNEGNFFAPSVVTDGNGCQSGKNVLFEQPGVWVDPCLPATGLTGDWLFYVVYRPESCVVDPSGSVPDGDTVPGTPLEVELFLGGPNLLLSWGNSCNVTDTDYEVYEGSLSNFYSHTSVLCSTSGATGAIVLPSIDSAYYLVVPNNGTREGNYGVNSSGANRPPGSAACLPQEVGVCP